MRINGVRIDDTFAEAFPMKATRLIVTARNADDLAVEKAGATVLVDPVSLEFLKGAEIDFAEELIGAAFRINNPNATSSCGCGTSFSV